MTDKTEQPRANVQDFGVRTYECYNCGVTMVMYEEHGQPKGWTPSIFKDNYWCCGSCAPRVTE